MRTLEACEGRSTSVEHGEGLLVTAIPLNRLIPANVPEILRPLADFGRINGVLLFSLIESRRLAAYEREAVRLLHTIIGALDVTPSPVDGVVRFAFQGNVELCDRLAMWGASIEDLEIDEGDAEPDADLEDDARCLDKARSELDEIREVARGALAALNRERGVLVGPSLVAVA